MSRPAPWFDVCVHRVMLFAVIVALMVVSAASFGADHQAKLEADDIKAEVDKIWYQIEEQSRIDYVAREERERMMPQGRSTFGQPTGNDWSGTGTQRERRDRPFERKKARGSPSRAIEFASRFFG